MSSRTKSRIGKQPDRRPGLIRRDAQGKEFVYTQVSAAQPVALLSPISNTIALENQDSHRIAESGPTDIKAEELPDENVEVAQGPIPVEEATGPAEQVTWFEVDAEPAAQSEQNVPVMPQSPISDTNESSLRTAESEQTEIKTEEPPENMEVAHVPIPIEDAPVPAAEITQFEDGSEPEEREAAGYWDWLYPEDTFGEFVYPYQASATQPAGLSQQNVTVMPEFPTSSTITPENQNSHRIAESEQTDVKAGEPSDEQPAVAPGPTSD